MPITSAVVLPKLAVAEVNSNEYLSIIGSCLHISQVSRPDIAYAAGVSSRHSSTPGQQHMEAAINLVCYLYHTQNLFVQYTRTRVPLMATIPRSMKRIGATDSLLRSACVQQSLKQFLFRQKSTLMPITRGTTLPDEVLQAC